MLRDCICLLGTQDLLETSPFFLPTTDCRKSRVGDEGLQALFFLWELGFTYDLTGT